MYHQCESKHSVSDETPKRGNSPQPTVTERDDGNNRDDSNGNNSDDEHWFSDDSEERDLLDWLADLERNQDGIDHDGCNQDESEQDESEQDESKQGESDEGESDEDESDEDESDEDEEITHSVPFKCIGAAHENNYQHHLQQAYLALHQDDTSVKVNLRPEPLNPADPSAIAIDLDYGTGWTHVGYIASELCKYLHPLIGTGDILDVFVQHIKYRVDFMKMGFYPKIWIKRRGEWEAQVVRKSRSVR